MKRTLNFNFPITALNGLPLKDERGDDLNAGKILADNIAMTMYDKKEMIVKQMQWSMELYKTGVIEADNSDVAEIEKFVESTPRLIALVKYQLLQVLNGQEVSNGKEAKQTE